MADRGLLHRDSVEDFTAWATKRGWTLHAPKGSYEVLRLRHPYYRHPFLAYDRGRGDHLSVPMTPDGRNVNGRIVRRYLKDKRAGRWPVEVTP